MVQPQRMIPPHAKLSCSDVIRAPMVRGSSGQVGERGPTLAALGSTRDVMDHEEDPLLRWLLPDLSRAIIRCIMLIALFCVGFWPVFVIVADHQRGQVGDERGIRWTLPSEHA